MSSNGVATNLSVFSLLDALRRRKLFIIIPALLVTAGFTFFAFHMPNRYRASVSLAAEQTAAPEYLRHLAPPPLDMQDHLWVVREVLFSQPVLDGAAREMKEYRNVQGDLPNGAVESLKSAIDLKVDGEHTFTISYADAGNPDDAMNVSNKLAQLFVEHASANEKQKSDATSSVINDELEALKARIEAQSKDLHDYKTQNVHALPDHIDDNIRQVDSLKTQYQDRVTKISEEQARRTTVQSEIRELESKGVLDQTTVVEKTPDETRLDDLRFEEKKMETRGYTAKHPDLAALRRQIQSLETAIAAQPKKAKAEPSVTYVKYVELKSELQGIDQRLAGYRGDLKQIDSQIGVYSQRLVATPQNERVIEDKKREYDVGEKQFHALLDKQLDSKLSSGLERVDSGIAFAIVEPASLPAKPYSPQRERLILMGIVVGLALGLGLAFVLEQSDTSFATVDDYQAFTTLPVVGVIPHIPLRNGRKAIPKSPLVTLTDSDSVAAEQFRVFALKVQQQCAAAGARTLTVTSAAGGEGKSLAALNLAVAMSATVEGKVLLIDADMRRPRLHEYLKMTVSPGKGFHNLLLHPEDPQKFIVKSGSIYVIPGAVAPVNPIAALASPKARALFESLKQEFAFIIVDAPPTLPIADSHILSGLSDRVLFVVRARSTPRELFQHALESFDASNLLGAVLNDVDYQRSRYAYAYEYYKKAAA